MATVQREISDRTFFGKIVKWLFIAFNIMMLFWLVSGMFVAGDVADQAINDAERAGTVIGTTIAAGMLIMLWALGDIILGLLVLVTRRKKIITVEE